MDTLRVFRTGARALAFTLAAWLLGAHAPTAFAATVLLDVGDLSLMMETVQETLEKNRIGQSSAWENPATNRLGTVIPLRTYQVGVQPCREYQMTLTFEGGTEFASDSACRLPDGRWWSNSFPGLAGSRFEGQAYTYLYLAPLYYPYYYYRDPFWYYDPFWRNRYFFHFRYDYWGPQRQFRHRHPGPGRRSDGADSRSAERAQAFGGGGPPAVRGPSPDSPRAVPLRRRAVTRWTHRPAAHGQPSRQKDDGGRPAKDARPQPAAPARTGTSR